VGEGRDRISKAKESKTLTNLENEYANDNHNIDSGWLVGNGGFSS
jgi:hypothetical protein